MRILDQVLWVWEDGWWDIYTPEYDNISLGKPENITASGRKFEGVSTVQAKESCLIWSVNRV